MTGPREWRHAPTCAFRRGNGSLRGLPCSCGPDGVEGRLGARAAWSYDSGFVVVPLEEP